MTVTVPPQVGSAVTNLTVQDRSGAANSSIPITFGQVFAPGHVPSGVYLTARTTGAGAESVPLQMDVKARHADSSVRHAVLSARVPSLVANASTTIELVSTTSPPSSGAVTLSSLLATTFDAVVTLNVSGTTYTASARQLLQSGGAADWLAGPLVSEWVVSAPVRTSGGTAHPHLNARFNVRAYAGIDSVRVDVIVENAKSFASGPRNYTYDASVSIDGRGIVLTQNGVPHYRQGRWRRVFWWGQQPNVHVAHNAAYLQDTGAVPNYDRTISIPASTLDELLSRWNSSPRQLMGNGLVHTSMPDTGGRDDIGPLPRWDAVYAMTMDYRAKTASLGVGEQAGSWPIHYRDENTGLPVSIGTYPNLWRDSFPSCGGSCGNSWSFDSAHQPSLAYLPYLVTGDEFYLEEVQFWANYNWLQVEPSTRGGASGYVTWDQVRGQAWQLRTLGQAAYITPDAHPLKSYFASRVIGNIQRYDQLFTNNASANQLGMNNTSSWWNISNPPGIQVNNFLDDFFTWSVGGLVEMGFTEAIGLRAWKSKYPVSRMTDSTYCWLLAAPYESMAGPPNTWASSIGDTYDLTLQLNNMTSIRGMACNSPEMVAELRRLDPNNYGGQIGEMVGYAWSALGYPSNMQPALAVARDSGIPNSDLAWSRFYSRSVKPSGGAPYGYSYAPQFAIVPRTQ